MYKILLCLRYLRTRYIALASIISVTLGVATMIVVNSVMAGFSTEMRDRIHGILADVVVETHSLSGIKDAELQMAIARRAIGEHIAGMTTTVEVYGMLSFEYAGQYITQPVTLIGIKPEEKAKVGPLMDYLTSYNPVTRQDPKTGEQIVIRPPLRSREIPPGWELTEEALAHRRLVAERNRELYDYLNHGIESTDDFNPLEPFPILPQESQQDESSLDGQSVNEATSSADDSNSVEDSKRADPKIQQAETEPALAEPPKFETETPPAFEEGTAPVFPEDEGMPPFAQESAEDSVAPLRGRLYVGKGLVTFLDKDRETGETVTVRMVQPGDDVRISTVTAGRPPDAVHFKATLVDYFKSGMSEYDSNLVFCNLEFLQEMRGMYDPDSGQRDPLTGEVDPSTCVKYISSIQIKLKDFSKSDEVVERLKAAFPPGMFKVRTWEQKQGPLLAAVDVEAAILNVLLFLIIAVAGFGILAIFFMIVVEKTKDIGILKALGASSRGVMSIFLSYGLALGIVGSGMGVGLGLLFVHYIDKIEKGITWLTGQDIFDERIYYFDTIPTFVNPMMVFWVAFGAMTIAVLASVFPAIKAARLHPVEALRYE